MWLSAFKRNTFAIFSALCNFVFSTNFCNSFMKKTAFIILSAIALYSCGGPDKPAKLLSEKEMENILYDMSMLQAIKSFAPKELDDNKVDARTYIFKKYKIDSLTMAQNHQYYAQDLEGYKKIQKNITDRLAADKEKITGKKAVAKPAGNTPTTPPPSIAPVLPTQKQAEINHNRDSVRASGQKNLLRAPSRMVPRQ
jgi:hypothetical protein